MPRKVSLDLAAALGDFKWRNVAELPSPEIGSPTRVQTSRPRVSPPILPRPFGRLSK